MTDDSDRIIEEEAKRLGAVIDALEEKAKAGDVRAIDRLVKLAKERARLVRQLQPKQVAAPKEKPRPPLGERHRRFVEAYMGEAAGNASEAARIAGYSPKRAKAAGLTALSHPSVKAAIEERQRGDPLIATREERQRLWTSIARGEPQMQLIDGKGVVRAPALRDRILALQHLAKASGDFVERVKHEGHIGHEIVVVELPANARGDR